MQFRPGDRSRAAEGRTGPSVRRRGVIAGGAFVIAAWAVTSGVGSALATSSGTSSTTTPTKHSGKTPQQPVKTPTQKPHAANPNKATSKRAAVTPTVGNPVTPDHVYDVVRQGDPAGTPASSCAAQR